MLAYARNAEIWRPNPSAGKVPTIWSAAGLGAAREGQRVAPSHLYAPYPLIPKPVGFLRRILRIAAAGPEALILDPFAGSGTTAQAVLEQNASDGGHREFVLIEADSHARTLISRRLAEVPGGPTDYDFYTLALDREGIILPNFASARFARNGSKDRGPQEVACLDSSSGWERKKGQGSQVGRISESSTGTG